MAHLSHFGLENFRVFKDKTDFEFRPITILTGTNSSGKSSLTKGIMLMQQCFKNNDINNISLSNLEYLRFNDRNQILGNFDTIRNRYSDKEDVVVSLPFRWWGIVDKMTLSLTYQKDGDSQNGDAVLQKLTIAVDNLDKEIYSLVRNENTKDPHSHLALKELGIKGPDELEGIKDIFYVEEIDIPILKDLFDQTLDKIYESLRTLIKLNELIGPSKGQIYRFSQELIESKKTKLSSESIKELDQLLLKWEYQQYYINFDDQMAVHDEFYLFEFISNPIPYYQSILDIAVNDENYIVGNRSEMLNDMDALLVGVNKRKDYSIMHNELQKININKTIYDYSFLNIENKRYYKEDIQLIKKEELKIFSRRYNHDKEIYLGSFDITDQLPGILEDVFNSQEDEKRKIDIGLLYERLSKELEYDIQINDISEGIYHKCFKNIVENGIKGTFISLFKALRTDSIAYVPSVRSIPSRVVSRQFSSTYYEDLIERISRVNPNKETTAFLQKWIQAFGIADDIKINAIGSTGIKEILLLKDDEEINIADVGYGFSQLLPIILNVAFFKQQQYSTKISKNYIQIIEEPETNLHPALQSKLADFFVECYEQFNIQFIIETHSEYLIRKLQSLIAQKKFKHDDANIYYFYSPNKIPDGENQVKRINFDTNGTLDGHFGQGFFDEANNLSIELFQLSRGQKN